MPEQDFIAQGGCCVQHDMRSPACVSDKERKGRIVSHQGSEACSGVCVCAGVFDCKPLPVLWGRFPEYTPDNTIMFDDLRRNYVFNPQNGLVIRPYRYSLSPVMMPPILWSDQPPTGKPQRSLLHARWSPRCGDCTVQRFSLRIEIAISKVCLCAIGKHTSTEHWTRSFCTSKSIF